MSKEQVAAGAELGGSLGKMVSGFRAGSAIDRQTKAAARQRMLNAEVDIRQSRRDAEQVLGKTRAATAASGLVMSGSPLEAMLDSAREAELEVELTRRGALIEAQNIKTRGRSAAYKARSSALGGLTEFGLGLNKHKNTLTDLWEQSKGLFD